MGIVRVHLDIKREGKEKFRRVLNEMAYRLRDEEWFNTQEKLSELFSHILRNAEIDDGNVNFDMAWLDLNLLMGYFKQVFSEVCEERNYFEDTGSDPQREMLLNDRISTIVGIKFQIEKQLEAARGKS